MLVVCKVGSRSAQVAGYLVRNGLRRGEPRWRAVDWESAGRPMVSETATRRW